MRGRIASGARLARVDDLVAFLKARLDEDGAAAWAVHDVSKCDALLYEEDMAGAARRDPGCDCGWPARVLREMVAMRAIVDGYGAALERPYDLPEGVHDGRDDGERSRDEAVLDAMRAVAGALATIWSGHPDYRQEWKP